MIFKQRSRYFSEFRPLGMMYYFLRDFYPLFISKTLARNFLRLIGKC